MIIVGAVTLGQFILPRENPTGSSECTVYEGKWERVLPDGTREFIELPGQCAAQNNEVVRLETILPQIQGDIWLCMRASQQDMSVYVADELRTEYSTRQTRIFGKNSASAYVFFEVTSEDAGKVLAIELVSDSEYAGFLNKVYIGEKYDIASFLIRECFVVIAVSVWMLIVSSVFCIVGVLLRLVYKVKVDITYLAFGILQLSMAMITESNIRQFFLINSSIASDAGFLLTILVPYPFMVYISRLQKNRYEKIYKSLSVCVAVNFFASLLLQVTGIVDLGNSVTVAYIIIIVMLIVFLVTICRDFYKGKIQEYGEVLFGLIAMIVITLWESYLTFVPKSPYPGGVAQSFGLIFLLFAAGIKTVRDLLEKEQEKQIAIAAGAAKTNFLANMSHEIRTPINTIIGMNEMILRESHETSVEEYANSIKNAGNLLLGLVNDVLDFSKIEAGKLDIIEEDYQLSKLLTDVIEGAQLKAENKNLKFIADVDRNLPSVLSGDEVRIRQILNNLLSNAVKYTSEGTVTLKVRGVSFEDKFILDMSVEDTGIGIKEESINTLFESFQRLEEERNRYIEGTGLGLNITKQLTELMGGNIAVESEYGKGSCFVVKIPQKVVDASSIGVLEEAYRRDISENKPANKGIYLPDAKVLVVDDNIMNLAVAEALLKRTGIQLTKANGGIECLELCREKKYDLILMDHMMPDPDGIETLHMLREDTSSLNRNTEVIVLTANAIAGAADEYKKEGFSDYLSKPIIAVDLEALLERYLNGK